MSQAAEYRIVPTDGVAIPRIKDACVNPWNCHAIRGYRVCCVLLVMVLACLYLPAVVAAGDDPPTNAAQAKKAEEEAAAKKAAEKKAAEAAARKEREEAAKKEQEQAIEVQAQQYIQMLQPSLWTELDFVRQVCDLAPQQRPKIKAAGEAALKQAAREIINPNLRGGRVLGGAGRRPATQTTAAQSIRATLSQALKETLSAEQFASFSQEAAQRTAHRKQAAILSVVARLDGLLCLNTQQRDKIVEALTSNWQDEWEQWFMLQNYGAQYFPEIPDQHVTVHLTEEQRDVWRGVQKISVNFWGGDGRVRAHDDWWDGKEEKKGGKAKAEAVVQ